MKRIKVGIIDYQSGNVRSVANAVDHAGGNVIEVKQPRDIADCTHLVLPGVGAFGFCAERLRESGLLPAVEQWAIHDARPMLGICVGMQLLADYSEEQGRHEGLGWIGGTVRKLQRDHDAQVRVPHVGWNEVEFRELFGEVAAGECPNFYFDHSFAYDAPMHGTEVGVATHGQRFSAVVRRDNIVGVQFHPEKSQGAGLRVLRSFFAL
jgi:glutamine amidotransferase